MCLTRQSNTFSPYLCGLSSNTANSVSKVSCKNWNGDGNRRKRFINNTTRNAYGEIKEGGVFFVVWQTTLKRSRLRSIRILCNYGFLYCFWSTCVWLTSLYFLWDKLEAGGKERDATWSISSNAKFSRATRSTAHVGPYSFTDSRHPVC